MHLAMQIGKNRSLPKKNLQEKHLDMHLLLKCTVYRDDMRQNLHVVRLHIFVKIYNQNLFDFLEKM